MSLDETQGYSETFADPLSAQGGLNLPRADLERSVNLPSKGILGRNLEGFNAHTILLIMSHSSAARLEGDPS